ESWRSRSTRRGCDRDSPRGTPALSPSSLSAVDGDDLSRDPARILRREEEHAIGDVVGRAQSLECDALDKITLTLRPIRFPLSLRGRVRAHESWRDVVDRNAP